MQFDDNTPSGRMIVSKCRSFFFDKKFANPLNWVVQKEESRMILVSFGFDHIIALNELTIIESKRGDFTLNFERNDFEDLNTRCCSLERCHTLYKAFI